MANTYNDRMRWQDEAARRAEGFAPDMPGDAFALYAVAELATRMGWGAEMREAADNLIDHEYMAGFDEIDRELAREDLATVQQESDEALIARVVRAVARQRAYEAKQAAQVAA